MPDWTAPFKMPHMTTEAFEKQRAEYVAKHGYRLSIPGYDDIIKLDFEKPMTPAEQDSWRRRAYGEISDERVAQIRKMKEYRRKKYLDMLASPEPEIFRARASILTSIDNAQDALSTAAAVGMVAAKVAPRAISEVISGPIGWIMTAADCLNMATAVIAGSPKALQRKRLQDSQTTDNPFSKKARVKRAAKLRKAKIRAGTVIEALQTTEGIFGVGISLGAIMNLPIALASGLVRRAQGQKVTIKWPQPTRPIWQSNIQNLGFSVFLRLSHRHGSDEEELTSLIIASNACMQAQGQIMEKWHPLDLTDVAGDSEMRPPEPSSALALEILNEEDPNWHESLVWPSTGKFWSSINDLIDSASPVISDNLKNYSLRNKHNFMGLIGSMNASQSGMYAIQAMEGEGSVDTDYTAWCKTIHALLDQGYVLPADVTEDQKACLINWLEAHEKVSSVPTTPEVLDYVKHNCGWEFQQEE